MRDSAGRAKVAAPSASDDIARKAEVDTKVSKSGDKMTGPLIIAPAGTAAIEIGRVDGVASNPFIDFHSGAIAVDYDSRIVASGGTGVAGGGTLNLIAANVITNGYKIWHAGNDGAGSGLDADLWRGKSFLDVGFEYQAGNNIVVYNDSDSVSTPATSYTEKKACIIGRGGTVRISFTLRSFSSSTTVYGRIYKNGVAVGTERSTTSTGYVVFTEDIAVSQNDRISLYLRTSSSGNPAFSQEFVIRVNYDGSTYKVIL
jgi:hypothetical protein